MGRPFRGTGGVRRRRVERTFGKRKPPYQGGPVERATGIEPA
jgi:hypothetical protein